jgi:hypothetical protein
VDEDPGRSLGHFSNIIRFLSAEDINVVHSLWTSQMPGHPKCRNCMVSELKVIGSLSLNILVLFFLL